MHRSTYAPAPRATFRVRWDAVGNLACAIGLVVVLMAWLLLAIGAAWAREDAREAPQVGADAPPVTFIVPDVSRSAESGDAFTLPPCATEDQDGCYWDAPARGNGQGRSFWSTPDGQVFYVDTIAR